MSSEDIAFCNIDCKRKTCRRNKLNIKNPDIPHSFYIERPPDCPYRRHKDRFYHIKGAADNA